MIVVKCNRLYITAADFCLFFKIQYCINTVILSVCADVFRTDDADVFRGHDASE